MKKERDDAWEDIRSFQGALDLRTKEMDQIQAELDKIKADFNAKRSVRESAEKRASDAEKKLTEHSDSLPSLEQVWITECINSCADEVLLVLAKEFQAGYDFALNKMNLPADHELQVAMQRPDLLEIEDQIEEEEEGAEHHTEAKGSKDDEAQAPKEYENVSPEAPIN